jgi:hypothetical protein
MMNNHRTMLALLRMKRGAALSKPSNTIAGVKARIKKQVTNRQNSALVKETVRPTIASRNALKRMRGQPPAKDLLYPFKPENKKIKAALTPRNKIY